MPFKTRKQKEAARDRRFTFAANSLLDYKKVAEKKADEKGNVKYVAPEVSVSRDTFYVKADLVKILFISGFIILVQLIFWFLQSESILKF